MFQDSPRRFGILCRIIEFGCSIINTNPLILMSQKDDSEHVKFVNLNIY